MALTHHSLLVKRRQQCYLILWGQCHILLIFPFHLQAIDEKLGVAADAVVIEAAEGNDVGILATVAALPQSVRMMNGNDA